MLALFPARLGRITGMKTPDDLVNVDAQQAGGSWHVTLGGDGLPALILGPYGNPATAEQDAAKIRTFLTALLDSRKRPASCEDE